MLIQKSYANEQTVGKLYLVATPIGNLGDMTERAITTLREVAIVACEDTRQTMKLVTHFQLNAKLISYHDHNRFDGAHTIIEYLKQGKDVALVSDAGTPCISDPGDELVRLVKEEGITTIAIPGASATLTALVASSLPAKRFYFHGFLERKEKVQKLELQQLLELQATLIFYESPHRVKQTMQNMLDVFGNRKACIARELTKKFETYITGTLEELCDYLEDTTLKGECVLLIEGMNEETLLQSKQSTWEHLTIREHVIEIMEEKNVSSKDAMKEVGKLRNVSKREVYAAYHEIEQ